MDNIVANRYEYEILEKEGDRVLVKICGHNVLLNKEYVDNELFKHKFYETKPNDKYGRTYFVSRNTGKSIMLHQSVWKYYNQQEFLTESLDHVNHNIYDNTIENLNPVHQKINSMNRIHITPSWDDKDRIYKVAYVMGQKRINKSFSVAKYKTKEAAYEAAIKYINEVAILEKIQFIEKLDYDIKLADLEKLIKYFKNTNNDKIVANLVKKYEIKM